MKKTKQKIKFKQNKPVKKDYINVPMIGKVESLAYSSFGVLKNEGKVVFVPYTVTGDVISFEIEKEKKTFSEGKLVEVLNSSPYRRKPLCPYFGKCGGCQWQHVIYEHQLTSKKQIVKDLFERIGKIYEPFIDEIIPSDSEWYYRNRVRFQVGKSKDKTINLGFAIYNSNDVVDIETCYIVKKPIVELLKKIRNYKTELQGVYDFEVYYSETEDQYIFYAITRDITAFNNVRRLPELFKGGILYDKKTKRSITIKSPFLNYKIKGESISLDLKINAGGFIQANESTNAKIISTLLKELGEHKEMKLLELYAGSGNFTIPLSKLFKQVVAVEGSGVSAQALEENVYKANAMNVITVKNDVEKEVVKSFNLKKKYDVIFIDPPRIGAKDIMTYLPHLGAHTIAYLSCNPATLARDLQLLINSGFSLEKVIPFDMFPQTFHIESLAILKR